jgi:type II pantothenate kinase
MTNLQKTPIIGIDRGASFTDFAVMEAGLLEETFSIEKRDWKSISNVFNRLIQKYQTRHIVFTGSITDIPVAIERQVKMISEIDAIGFGGSALLNSSDCIVVSMGTGTAIVHFSNNRAQHVGGTGVGGGTIKGLSSLMCHMEDPCRIEALALKGKASKVNLTLSDLGYDELSFLGADMTASNFAAVKSKKPEDLAAGILLLVGETVGIIASICAREFSCQDRIVIVGKVAKNKYVRHILERVGKLYQTSFSFPENPGYATVYGAVVKYLFDNGYDILRA